MEDDHSLLAHLVPKLTPQVEDAATDALAFILNASESCRDALIDLVGEGDFRLASLETVKTQIDKTQIDKTQVEPHSTVRHRLDLVGYDEGGAVPLIIESKFWAPLLDGQASRYVDYLTASGSSLLLFVAPVVRHAALWTKIQEQFARDKPEVRLEPVECGPDMKAVHIANPDEHKRVALTSWTTLLNALENADASAAPDVKQIKGLARTQDDAAFSPLHAGDFSTTIPRRIMNFNLIADDVVDARGVPQGWMTTKGLRATPQHDGYLRYFRFCSSAGGRLSSDIALYVSCNQWLKTGATPLWLRVGGNRSTEIEAICNADADVEYAWSPGDHLWIPLRLMTGVEYDDVLDDVVAQVKRVRDIVLA